MQPTCQVEDLRGAKINIARFNAERASLDSPAFVSTATGFRGILGPKTLRSKRSRNLRDPESGWVFRSRIGPWVYRTLDDRQRSSAIVSDRWETVVTPASCRAGNCDMRAAATCTSVDRRPVVCASTSFKHPFWPRLNEAWLVCGPRISLDPTLQTSLSRVFPLGRPRGRLVRRRVGLSTVGRWRSGGVTGMRVARRRP